MTPPSMTDLGEMEQQHHDNLRTLDEAYDRRANLEEFIGHARRLIDAITPMLSNSERELTELKIWIDALREEDRQLERRIKNAGKS